MGEIKRVRYNNINCVRCGGNLTADLAAFDFGIVFAEAIRYYLSKTRLSTQIESFEYMAKALWKPIVNLDLRFYLTIRDICQDYGFKMMKDDASVLVLRAKNIIRQIEFIANGVPYSDLQDTIKQIKFVVNGIDYHDLRNLDKNKILKFNSLFDSIRLRHGLSEDKIEEIRLLFRYLSGLSAETEIINVPIRIVLSKDDNGNEIAHYVEYYTGSKKRILKERVCPGCGMPIDHEAGYRNEIKIGMAGLSRVGKTAYLASLISQLSKKDNSSYIHIIDNESESLKEFRETIVSQYEKGEEIEKTTKEDEGRIPLIYLPLQIGTKIVNFVFVDMPGEVFGNAIEDNLDYISNHRTAFQNVDIIWCCLEPALIDSGHVNKHPVIREENSNKQLSGLINVLEVVVQPKKPAALIITQSDLLQKDTSLFRPDTDILLEYLLMDNSLDFEKTMQFAQETMDFVDKMNNFRVSIKGVFVGISAFAVSSYGFDISQKVLLTNRVVKPSMVELPFLWTLGVLGLIKVKQTTIEKRLVGGTKTIAKEINNSEALFLRLNRKDEAEDE